MSVIVNGMEEFLLGAMIGLFLALVTYGSVCVSKAADLQSERYWADDKKTAKEDSNASNA